MERLLERKKITYHVLLVILLLTAAICAPQVFLSVRALFKNNKSESPSSSLMLGIDSCNQALLKKLLKNTHSFALIANSLSINSSGRHTIDHFVSHGFVPHCCLSTDEFHFGIADASYLYQTSHQTIPCVCLYEDNQLSTENLNTVDTIVFDLSDRELSSEVYQRTMLDIMTYAHVNHKRLIILDRPTQVSGAIEGTLKLIASDSYMRLPIAHGLTMGELATFYNNQLFNNEIEMRINPMKHFVREDAHVHHTDTSYIKTILKPFQAIMLFDTAQTTDIANQCILLSDAVAFDRHHWFDLRSQLKEYGIDARMYRYYNDLKKEHLTGLQLFSVPGTARKPIATTVFLLQFFKQKGLAFHLNEHFDDLFGTHKIRHYIEGKVTKDVFAYEMNSDLKSYFQKVYQSFLYKPVPIVVTL